MSFEELPLLYCSQADGAFGKPCSGRIFQDARGGFECTDCDARYLIVQEPAQGYGGPNGPLNFFERHQRAVDLAGTAGLVMTGCFMAEQNGLAALVSGVIALCITANAALLRRSIDEGREKPIYPSSNVHVPVSDTLTACGRELGGLRITKVGETASCPYCLDWVAREDDETAGAP